MSRNILLQRYKSLVSISLFLLCLPVFGEAAAELQAEKSVFDFGQLQEGVNTPVNFTIKNSGDRKVLIKEIRTFAACVQSQPLEKNSLDPGESLALEYVFESLGYGGADIQKSIEVHYNNRRKSPLILLVKGQVRPLESHQASLGELAYNFYVLVDIRQPGKYEKEHILGAINIPRPQLLSWAEKASQTLSDEIIIYLYSEEGEESDAAAVSLRERGFIQFLSLVGGLKEWKQRYKNKLLITGEK
jgi:rhodanese-related sulfurtransferase